MAKLKAHAKLTPSTDWALPREHRLAPGHAHPCGLLPTACFGTARLWALARRGPHRRHGVIRRVRHDAKAGRLDVGTGPVFDSPMQLL